MRKLELATIECIHGTLLRTNIFSGDSVMQLPNVTLLLRLTK